MALHQLAGCSSRYECLVCILAECWQTALQEPCCTTPPTYLHKPLDTDDKHNQIADWYEGRAGRRGRPQPGPAPSLPWFCPVLPSHAPPRPPWPLLPSQTPPDTCSAAASCMPTQRDWCNHQYPAIVGNGVNNYANVYGCFCDCGFTYQTEGLRL